MDSQEPIQEAGNQAHQQLLPPGASQFERGWEILQNEGFLTTFILPTYPPPLYL